MLTLSTKSTTEEKEEILKRIENIFLNKVIDEKMLYNKTKMNLSFLLKVLLSIGFLYLMNVKIISIRVYIVIVMSPLICLVFYFLFGNKKTVRIEDLFLKLQEEMKKENIEVEDEKHFFYFYIRFYKIKLYENIKNSPIQLSKSASTYLKTETFSDISLVDIWNSIDVFPDEKDFFDIGGQQNEQ